MELLLGVVFVWCYIVIGFVVLALIAGAVVPFDTGDIEDVGISAVLFWPAVLMVTIVRRRRGHRAKAELSRIPDRAQRTARAYELLGRSLGDHVLQEIARQQSCCPLCVKEEGQRHEPHCRYYETGTPHDVWARHHELRRKRAAGISK